MSIEAAKLQAIVEAETAKAEAGLERASQRFDQLGKTAYTAAERARAFNTVASELAGPLALLSGAGVAAGVGLFQAASKAEQTGIAFKTMLGSAESARAMLGQLRDFAAQTPFQFNELTVASQRLMAMGFAARDVIPVLRDVGDAAAGLAAGQEGVDRMVRALGQMEARGKVSSQEMLQLTEIGVPAWRYLAEAMGVTTGELQKMVEKGLVPASAGIEAIRAGIQSDFGGLMAQQAKTAAGQLSNLQDSAEKLAATWGDTLIPAATEVIQSAQRVTDALGDMNAGQRETVLTVGGTVAGVAALGSAALAAAPHLASLGSAVSVLAGGLELTGAAAVAAGGAVAAAAAAWAVALGMVVDTYNKVRAGQQAVADATRQHSQEMVTAAGSYAEYRGELERVASLQGYLIDQNGDLINGAGTVIQANYALSEAVFDAARSSEVGGEYQRELNRATADFRPAAESAATGLQDIAAASLDAKEAQKAFQAQVDQMNYLVNGPVGKANDDYVKQQAELRLRARELTEELEKLEASQGQQYTVQSNSALSANELSLAQLKLADAQQKLNGTTDPMKQAQLQVEIDKLTEKISGATTVTSGFVDNSKRIGEIKTELEGVNTALDTNAAKYEDSMKRIAFAMLQERVAADGWQEGDMTMLAQVGEAWGIFDGKTREMLTKVDGALTTSKGNAEDFLKTMGFVYSLPDKTINIRVNAETQAAATVGENYGGWTPPKTTTTTTPRPPEVAVDGMLAGGGPVSAGGTYWVGERGPELFTPPVSGAVVPVSAGGNTITINVSGVQDPERAAELTVQKLQDRGVLAPVLLR